MGYETKIDFNTEKSEEKISDILSLFTPVEGETAFYFGHIRNGKTGLATADAIALLDRGEIVVANWKIDWQGYDERRNFKTVLFKALFGRKFLYSYKKENFIFIPPTELRARLPEIAEMVNVHLFLDEAQWILNSAERFNADNPESVAKMALILHNGHYCRSLNIISQRPTNVFRTMRSQINIWYYCEKVLTWPVLLFRKTTIQDMTNDDLPDMASESNTKAIYWPSKRVLNSYDTHAMQGPDAKHMVSQFDVYETNTVGRILNVLGFLRRRRRVPTATSAKPTRSIRDIKRTTVQ